MTSNTLNIRGHAGMTLQHSGADSCILETSTLKRGGLAGGSDGKPNYRKGMVAAASTLGGSRLCMLTSPLHVSAVQQASSRTKASGSQASMNVRGSSGMFGSSLNMGTYKPTTRF